MAICEYNSYTTILGYYFYTIIIPFAILWEVAYNYKSNYFTMDFSTKYEKKIRKKYPQLYDTIKDYVDDVPDQRLFESESIKATLSPWNPYLIWKSLYRELQTLDSSAHRGDKYDKRVYEILNGPRDLSNINSLAYSDINKLKPYKGHIGGYGDQTTDIKDMFKYNLTNFIATYPILSYLLITINKLHTLAIMGSHPIIIKAMAVPSNSKYILHNIAYSTNKQDIKILLSNIDIHRKYLVIAHNAAKQDNELLFRLLWERLDHKERTNDLLLPYIVQLDLLDIFIESTNDRDIVDDKIWRTALDGKFKILKYLVKNFELRDFFVIHEALYYKSRTRLTLLKIISKKFLIKRFNKYGTMDLLKEVIENADWRSLKFLIDYGIDINSDISYETDYDLEIVDNDNSDDSDSDDSNDSGFQMDMSPLLFLLHQGAPEDITEYMISKYNIDDNSLLYLVIKNGLIIALRYLLRTRTYSNKVLRTALRSSHNSQIRSMLKKQLRANKKE